MFKLRYLSIHRLVFLVKRVGPDGPLYFTQFVQPDVVPKKVYFCGYDVTKFLTFKNTLTNFSYIFLCNIAFDHSFSVKEVRAFFRINNSAKMRRVRKLAKNTITVSSVPVDSTPGLEDITSSVRKRSRPPALSDDDIPLSRRVRTTDATPSSSSVAPPPSAVPVTPVPGLELGARLLAASSESVNIVGLTAFKKFVVFDSALKLVFLNIEPNIRFTMCRAEYYYTLITNGLPFGRCLSAFKDFLSKVHPYMLNPKFLTDMVNDVIRFTGRRVSDMVLYTPLSYSVVDMSRIFEDPFQPGLSTSSR